MLVEQFSIGLRFQTNDKMVGKITLIRYNGAHGQIDWSKDKHHSAFHIHKITAELLAKNIYEPKDIEITERFATFDSALSEFIKYTNIINHSDYFPPQMSLLK